MKSQSEYWKEKILNCKIIDIEINNENNIPHINYIIIGKNGINIKLFPDEKTGINAIHIGKDKK